MYLCHSKRKQSQPSLREEVVKEPNEPIPSITMESWNETMLGKWVINYTKNCVKENGGGGKFGHEEETLPLQSGGETLLVRAETKL